MNEQEIYDLANELMAKQFEIKNLMYSARGLGYKFKMIKSANALGQCSYTNQEIRLSRSMIGMSRESIEDTILHEIAHALAGWIFNDHKHGRSWKHVCELIGAVPYAKTTLPKLDEEVWEKNVRTFKKTVWILRHKITHEIYATYFRKPTKKIERIEHIWIKGKREHTHGKLEVVRA